MLDRTDFALWKQCIQLYCQGKENRVDILKSIDKGPFQMGTFRETLVEGDEGALHLGPERPRVYSDLSPEDKRGFKLTKEERESQLYDDFEHFRQNKGETIHDYYVRFAKLINDMRNIKMTMSRMQLNSKFVNKMLPEWGRFVTAVKLNRGLRDSNYDQLNQAIVQDGRVIVPNVQGRQNRGQGNDARGICATSYGGAQNRVGNANPSQSRQIKCYNCNGIGHIADECDAFDSDVDEAPTAQTMLMVNLSSVDPVYDQAGPSYDSDILSEVNNHDNYQDVVCGLYEVHEMHEHVQPNCVVDSNAKHISDSNMILYDQYVKDNAELVVQNTVSSVPHDAFMMIINEMHEHAIQCVSVKAHTKVVDASLTAKLTIYREQVELYERRAKFELTEHEQKIEEQLRIVITDHNIKDENLKKELHSVKIGQEIVKPNHARVLVHDSEDTLEIAETTRKQMNKKIKDPECVKNKVKIVPQLSKLTDKIQKDDHNELVKHFSNLIVPSLSASIMSNTPGPSTLTYDTISFGSKLKKTKWLMRMFSLLPPQDLMIKYFYLLYGCPLERAVMFWIFKRSKRIQSFRSLWIFYKTQTSLGNSPPQSREALEITPIDQAHQFVSPPSCDAIMDFVNELRKNSQYSPKIVSPFHLAEEDLRLVEATWSLPVVEDKGKAIATKEQAAQSLLALHTPKRRRTTYQFILQRRNPTTKEASTGPSAQPQDDASANIVHVSSSPADAETCADLDKSTSGGDTKILLIDEDQEKDVDNQVNLEEKTAELDQGQARSDPGKTPESRPPPRQEFIEEDQAGPGPGVSRVALTGPNPEPTHKEFMANVYPHVHGSLKLPADEQVILEEPLSSSGTLSLMKNLDDAYTFGDRFLNDKSTEDEPGKLNMDSKVVYIVMVLIHQASSSVPPLSTSIIDLYPPKPVPATTHAPIFTATTTTTTTTPLEQKLADFKQKSKTLDNTTQNLGSRVFNLELWDLPHKIDQTFNTVVKEAVHIALQQAPLRDRFKELPEAYMKEILHQQMFESGSYKSLPEHAALYEALETSMEWENRDEFLVEKEKSCKRCRDDQDPPPPPSDSYPSKKRRHDLGASGSTHPSAPQSPAWKMSSTRETPSSSSRQKLASHSEQPIEKAPMPDTADISDSEDTDSAHLLKIKSRLEWLKPILEEDKPKTLEPDWSVPPNDLPEPENNWANALANSLKDPAENKLLRKTGDMRSFITWFYNRIGKKKLSKSNLEVLTFKVAKAFHKNIISLQFQKEECHRMLTDQVDLVNPEGHRLVPDVSKPFPLGGPPGQTLDLKNLFHPFWNESERVYDISAAYGISYWWFKCKEFYITRHDAPSDRSQVRSHMRILSVISLKTYERYGYAFLKEILCRADYKEYKISEADFKNLHPNDFRDMYLLHLQGQLNHLSGDDKVHLFNAVNMWIRNIDASDFLFKEDYSIVSKPREVIYKDRNNQKKMMRENEVHKFSDGTLQRILEKLDHMVKDFKLYVCNPGMETRIWSEGDRRRSNDFIEVIERRLKIRRIFRSLESFVGGRLRDVDYRLIQRTE
nr:hypothetical protein [Tanacetum cinerariifolium]